MKGSIIYFRQDSNERRGFFRLSYAVDVVVKIGGYSFDCISVNVSESGLGVSGMDELHNLTLGVLKELAAEPAFVHFKDLDIDIRGMLSWINCENYNAGITISDVSDNDLWDEICTPKQ